MFRLGRISATVSAESLAVFRMLLGAIVAVGAARLLWLGRVRAHFMEPEFHFTYPGFHWVQPLPGDWMIAFFVVIIVLGILLSLGVWLRYVALALSLCLAYELLIDQALYLNHMYLTAVLVFLVGVSPADQIWAIGSKELRMVPRGYLLLLQGQLLIVYTFAGISKLGSDWLSLAPLRLTLERFPFLPDSEAFIALVGYPLIVVELLAVPLLFWKRTRVPTLLVLVVFHITTIFVYEIGTFPFLCMATLTLFLPPDWPSKLWARLRNPTSEPSRPDPARIPSRAMMVGLGIFLALQLLIPLRHYFYPGPTSWTRQADRFSWRLIVSHATGWSRFLVTDDEGTTEVSPREYLTVLQSRRMSVDASMIRQFAVHLSELHDGASVRALSGVSFNGRPVQALVDPDLVLSERSFEIGADDFIVPLESALPQEPNELPPGYWESNMIGFEVLYRAAQTDHREQRLEQAIEGYRNALLVDPNHHGAMLNLGVAFRAHGDLEAAIETLERRTHQDADADAFLELGIAYQEAERFEDAERAYQQCVAARPDKRAHTALGFFALRARDPDQAIHHFEAALALDASFRPALDQAAILRFRHYGDAAGALRVLESSETPLPTELAALRNEISGSLSRAPEVPDPDPLQAAPR